MQKIKISLGSISLLLILFMTAKPVVAQSSKSFDAQKLSRYLKKLNQKDKMMASVVIDSAGTQVYEYSSGFLRPGGKPKANAQTRYRIGSVTKIYTATMIFQLIEEGKLSLSTKLSNYYPEISKADSISVRNMLHHQSGLFNVTKAFDYQDWKDKPQTHKQMLKRIKSYSSQFRPGTMTSYSNTNYILLGYILENITRSSYGRQLQQRIAKPLQLTHTYYGDGIDADKNEASSFRYVKSKWKEISETDMSVPGGAGGIVSTPADMTDFLRAVFKGDLISQQSRNYMTNIEQGLGMGLMKVPFHNTFAYGHTGGIDGFRSKLVYFPDQDVAVAFSSNGLNYSMNDGILNIYFGKDFDIPSFNNPTISFSKKQMKKFEGHFESPIIPLNFDVFIQNGTLKAQATGQPSFPLTAISKTTLRYEQAGIVMKFDSLANNKYQQFIFKQGGSSDRFMREKSKN